jgi:phosphate-selective porin OprO and OprP
MKKQRLSAVTLFVFLGYLVSGSARTCVADGDNEKGAAPAALEKRLEALEQKLRSLESRVNHLLADQPANGQGNGNQSGLSEEPIGSRFEALDQKVRILERKGELDSEAAAAKSKTATTVTAGASGFAISSADNNFVLRIRGGVQTDGRFYAGNSTANDTFLLRRVRPIIEGKVYEKFDYRVMVDFASGVSLSAPNNSSVLDAYGDLRLYPEFNIRVGKFKEPVGLERLQSWSNLRFVERGFPTQLLPNRDTGIMLHGGLFDARLNYELGMFNGTPDGGSSDFEVSDTDKDVAARLFTHPFKKSGGSALRGLGFGVAGTFGKQNRVPRAYNTHGSQRFFGYRNGTAAAQPNVLGDGTQWRLSPQAYWYWGRFGLFGEYAISSQELRQAGGGAGSVGTLRNTGWQIEASYFLTGDENSYRPVSPSKPFTLGGKGWGAFELTARAGELDPDDAAFPIFADPAISAARAFSWGFGFNWHLNRFFKVTLNYENTDLKGFDGSYTGIDKERVILTRLQATF